MWNIETLNDLIGVLQDLAEQETSDGKAIGDLPVCIAHQKQWPLAEAIEAVTVADRNGDKVCLDEIGMLKLEIESDKVDNPSDFNPKKHIRGVRVHFIPESIDGVQDLYDGIEYKLG